MDFEADEVRDVLEVDGVVYALVNDFQKKGGGDGGEGMSKSRGKGTPIKISKNGPPLSAGSLPRPSKSKARSAVYRIDGSGAAEQLFMLPKGYMTAIRRAPGVGATPGDGANDIFVSEGSAGRVYRLVSPAGGRSLWTCPSARF